MAEPDAVSELEELEGRVHELVEVLDGVRVERDELRAAVRERDDALREARARAQRLEKSRDQVRKRIDGLLGELARLEAPGA